eukprot:403334550
MDSDMALDYKQMLDKGFPTESELNVIQSTARQVGRSETLATDNSFLTRLYQFIEETNYMRIQNMPSELKIAIQLLMCERTFLIQLIKGLIDRILPKDKPKIFNDPFLEQEFKKLEKKQHRDLTPQLETPNHIPPQSYFAGSQIDRYNSPSSQIQDYSVKRQLNYPLSTKNQNNNPSLIQQQRQQQFQGRNNQHTVVGDIVIGATNLIGAIGKKLASPVTQKRYNTNNLYNKKPQVDNLSNPDNRVVYLRIPPSDEKKVQQTSRPPIPTVNQYEQLFHRKEQVLLKVETKSDDDDDSVDIPSSSSSDEKARKSIGNSKAQSHKHPSRGISNIMSLKMNANQSNFSNNRVNEQPSTFNTNHSYIRQNSKLTSSKEDSKLFQQNHKQKKSLSQNRYQRSYEDDDEEIKELGYNNDEQDGQYEQLRLQQRKNLIPIQDFMKMLQSTDTAHQSRTFNINRNDESQSTIMQQSQNYPLNQFKQSTQNLQKSGIRMRDTYSKLHRDFSLASSQAENQLDQDNSKMDSQERDRRRSIGLKMLMSRESSFGVVGYKNEGGSDEFQSENPNMKSFGDDSEYNKQLHQVHQQRRKFGVEADSDDEFQEVNFKVKKKKDSNIDIKNTTSKTPNLENNQDYYSKPAQQFSNNNLVSLTKLKGSVAHQKTNSVGHRNEGDDYYLNSNGKEKTMLSNKHQQSTNDSQEYSSQRRDVQNSMFKSEFDLKLQNNQSNKRNNYLNASQAKSINTSVKWKQTNLF